MLYVMKVWNTGKAWGSPMLLLALFLVGCLKAGAVVVPAGTYYFDNSKLNYAAKSAQRRLPPSTARQLPHPRRLRGDRSGSVCQSG